MTKIFNVLIISIFSLCFYNLTNAMMANKDNWIDITYSFLTMWIIGMLLAITPRYRNTIGRKK